MDWIRAELHTHTVASDGDMSPYELAMQAAQSGVRVLAVTDHNTVVSVDRVRRVASRLDVSVLGGIEWTTFYGHIVVTGGRSDLDWRSVTRDNFASCIARAAQAGDAVTIAHPCRTGWPICPGGRFEYELDDWSDVHAIEVWSRLHPHANPTNAAALQLWQDRIDRGDRIAPVSGRDWHAPDAEGVDGFAHTYLAVRSQGADGALEALRAGRTYCALGIRVCAYWQDDRGGRYGFGEQIPDRAGTLYVDILPADDGADAQARVSAIECRVAGRIERYAPEHMRRGVEMRPDGTAICVRVCGTYGRRGDYLAICAPFYAATRQGERPKEQGI